MNTQFVIVVEVDNKRAVAGYAKGLADLDMAMPALLAEAKIYDDKVAAKVAEAEAKEAVEEDKYREARREYDDRQVKYNDWLESNSVFRGPAPAYVTLPSRPFPLKLRGHTNMLRTPYLERCRAALVGRLNLATAATKPFQMTEHDVSALIAWEDGSNVASLLAKNA